MKAYFIAALFCVFATTASFAQTETPCAPYPQVLKMLKERYGESPVSVALSSSGDMVQMFVNLDTGTWSLITLNPAGVACLRSSGYSFEFLENTDEEEGDPT